MNRFVRDLENGDAEGFMRRLEGFFANGDYQVMGDLEKYFQNTLYVIFRLLGFYVDVERHIPPMVVWISSSRLPNLSISWS